MTSINPNIFRAYDIRGKAVPTENQPIPDLTPETVEIIGQAIATYLIENYSSQNIAIGRDNRLHSLTLQQAFIRGALKTGINIIDLGLTTSPLTYFATCENKYDSAVNITASHNPAPDNGIKISVKNAKAIAGDEIQSILKIIQNNELKTSNTPGQLTEDLLIFEKYLEHIKNTTRLARPLKIVIDSGNGVAGKFAGTVLKSLGAEVIELFCELDGTFPNHEANPEKEKNLEDLKKSVIENKADLGIGFDGDGDRAGLIGNDGQFYSSEYILILLAKKLLQNHPGEKIIFDVKVSSTLISELQKMGANPIMARTGHSFMKEKLKAENATLAGEKSGHFFFGKSYFKWFGFDDGIFTAVKILEALSNEQQSLSELFKTIPKLPYLPEHKIHCPDEKKAPIIQKLTEHFQKNYPCQTIDGVRIQISPQSWALIRYSNTSPALTLFAEAPTENELNQIKSMMLETITPLLQSPSSP